MSFIGLRSSSFFSHEERIQTTPTLQRFLLDYIMKAALIGKCTSYAMPIYQETRCTTPHCCRSCPIRMRPCSFRAKRFVPFSSAFQTSLRVNGAFSFDRCNFLLPLPDFFVKESGAKFTLKKFTRAYPHCVLLHLGHLKASLGFCSLKFVNF